MKDHSFRQPQDVFAGWTRQIAHTLFPQLANHADAVAVAANPAKAPRLSLFDRLQRSIWNQRQRELERSLASAQDIFELERRLRAYERGVLERYY